VPGAAALRLEGETDKFELLGFALIERIYPGVEGNPGFREAWLTLYGRVTEAPSPVPYDVAAAGLSSAGLALNIIDSPGPACPQ
jgi:hypothetical protein